jgi:hypothetical protein
MLAACRAAGHTMGGCSMQCTCTVCIIIWAAAPIALPGVLYAPCVQCMWALTDCTGLLVGACWGSACAGAVATTVPGSDTEAASRSQQFAIIESTMVVLGMPAGRVSAGTHFWQQA